MTLMLRKTLVLVGMFVIGVIAGLGAANYFYNTALRAKDWFGAVGTDFMAGQYALTQYREADYPAASAAMEAYISYLDHLAPTREKWAPGQSPWLGPEGLLHDKALAWSRLAILHERGGNAAAAEAAWRQAEGFATRCHWRDTSREHIRSLVLRLDGQYASRVPGA
jgi:hypothetical protein